MVSVDSLVSQWKVHDRNWTASEQTGTEDSDLAVRSERRSGREGGAAALRPDSFRTENKFNLSESENSFAARRGSKELLSAEFQQSERTDRGTAERSAGTILDLLLEPVHN